MISSNDILQKAQELSSWFGRKLAIHSRRDNQRNWRVKRGEVYFVDLGYNIGSEENKIRPFVVIQANAYCGNSPVFPGAIISSSNVTIRDIQISITGNYTYKDKNGNDKNLVGAIDLGQMRTIAKERIIKRVCILSTEMKEVDEKIPNITGIKSLILARDNKIDYLNGKISYLQNQIAELQEKLNAEKRNE